MKKLFFFLFFLLLPMTALAADPLFIEEPMVMDPPEYRETVIEENLISRGQEEDWQYFSTEGGIEIWKYYGTDTNVTVPATINGETVVSLKQTFWGNSDIVSVELPESVVCLENGVFYECTSLQSVTGGTVSSIGNYVFRGCTSLEVIPELHEGITEITQTCFLGCSALTQVRLPESVVHIGSAAFENCSSLQSVTGGTVSSIEGYAFSGCSSLEVIPELHSGLTEIPKACFYNCSALGQVNIPATVTAIADWAFYYCSSLTEINTLENVTSIGYAGFYGCTSLDELDVPDTVTTFGEFAFSKSTTLIVGDGSEAYLFAVENNYKFRVRGEELLPDEIAPDATTVDEKANAIVAALITDGMSDYQKALVLHDYIIQHAYYDETYSKYTAEDILLGGTGVCQAYTEAYGELLTRAGIEWTTENGNNHVWNMVKIDGDWVHVDCTWDDPIPDGNERHDFFCITNYALEGVRSHECYNKPYIATSIFHSYAYVSGVLPRKIEALEGAVNEKLENGQLHSSLTDVFDGRDQYGIMDKMTVQGIGSFQLGGYTVTLDNDFDWQNKILSYDAYLEIPESETVHLPDDVTVLETESLNGTEAKRIVASDTLMTIEENAFPDGFVVIEAPQDSYALEYAEENDLMWQYRKN